MQAGWHTTEIGYQSMNEAQRASQEVQINGLRQLSDSQFLAFIAMQVDSVDEPLNNYMAKRLDWIAMLLDAKEAMEGDK